MKQLISRVTLVALSACGTGLSGALAADLEQTSGGLLLSGNFSVGAGAQYAFESGPADALPSDVDLEDGTALALSGEGKVSMPLSDTFSLQLDMQNEFYNRTSDVEGDAIGAGLLGAHLSLRDPGVGLVGLFAGAGQGSSMDSQPGSELGVFIGAEGQSYLGDVTLYGQAGYADLKVDDTGLDGEGFVEGWFVNGEVRYFLAPDIMVHGAVAYGETGSYTDGNEPGYAWNWGIGGAMRINDDLPLYGTLDYRGGRYHADEDVLEGPDDIEEHALLVGVSVLFGAPTLEENDRRGATLSSPMLPVRAAAWTEALD